MSTHVLLDSGAPHNFIAAPQVIKFSYSIQKSLLCSSKPMEVHLADNFLVIFHQIVLLPLQFADGAIHTAAFWVIPLLNHDIILGISSYIHSTPVLIRRSTLSYSSIPSLPLFHLLLFLQHLRINLPNLLSLQFAYQHSLLKLYKLPVCKPRPFLFT